MQFTEQHRENLNAYLKGREIPSGMGTKEEACSVAAINLAISGILTDDIPDCMSEVLGEAVIRLQDAMPDEMRNSEEYKALLPDMAGTGREREKERLSILLDWMWGTVLPQLQLIADKEGFGGAWETMCEERTEKAAAAAKAAAKAAAWSPAVDDAANAANAARAAVMAALAAARAVYAAIWAAKAINDDNFWKMVDPIALLKRMTYLETEQEQNMTV